MQGSFNGAAPSWARRWARADLLEMERKELQRSRTQLGAEIRNEKASVLGYQLLQRSRTQLGAEIVGREDSGAERPRESTASTNKESHMARKTHERMADTGRMRRNGLRVCERVPGTRQYRTARAHRIYQGTRLESVNSALKTHSRARPS